MGRMGGDFASLTASALNKFPVLDRKAVVYTGHSKGGFVAGVAAGLEPAPAPGAIVLIQPAGQLESSWSQLPKLAPLTLIYSDADDFIDQELVWGMYESAPFIFMEFLVG